MELKALDLNSESFIASGVTYFIKPTLSVERFQWFEKYQIEFGYGRAFKDISDLHKKAIDFANKGKGLEAWNIIFNLEEGIRKNLDGAINPALLICALHIVTENEDLTKWDEQSAKEKIKNWNDEGYDVNGFFRLAANLVEGYIENLAAAFQSISALAEATKQMEQSKE